MSAESLIGYLGSITQLSTEFTGEIKAALSEESYKPHQVIHAAGQMEHRLWYIDKGFARTYYFDQSGKEHTLAFYNEREIIFSHKGFWKETVDYYVEVLENTLLISLSYEQLRQLLERYGETKILIEVFTRNHFHQELFKSRLMTWSAEERYRQFRRANPDVFKKVSVRLIATYLNMTRENLSRLIGKDT